MKPTTSISLSVYEKIEGLIRIETIQSNMVKLLAALFMFPITLFFLVLAMLIEEPLKCLFELVTFRSSFKEVARHYVKCWSSFSGGIKSK